MANRELHDFSGIKKYYDPENFDPKNNTVDDDRDWVNKKAANDYMGRFMISESTYVIKNGLKKKYDGMLKEVVDDILAKPYEDILKIYNAIDNQINKEIQEKNVDQVPILMEAREYYKKNIMEFRGKQIVKDTGSKVDPYSHVSFSNN